MSKMVRAALAVSICVVMIRSSQASPATQKRTQAKPAVKLSENEERLVNAVNEYREERGLKPLKVDPILMQEARCAAPHFSHCINGRWCWHRCKQRGFQGWA